MEIDFSITKSLIFERNCMAKRGCETQNTRKRYTTLYEITSIIHFFFLSSFLSKIDDSRDIRGSGGAILISISHFPSAQEHSDIYLELCMSTRFKSHRLLHDDLSTSDNLHIFNVNPLSANPTK